jgi:CRP/FNR family transcriptional regulator, cyclic AMP receptor protein
VRRFDGPADDHGALRSLDAAQAEIVGRSALFTMLPREVADRLVSQMRWRHIPRQGVLYGPGDAGDKLFIVLQGRLQAFRADSYGRMRMLQILAPGEMIGELSLVDRAPRTATVAALTDAHVAILDHVSFEQLLEEQPRAAIELVRYFADRLRHANEAIADMALMDVKARVAKMILELAARFGTPHPQGVHVYHGLSQEDLARYVGASREMVNRALSDLQTRGVISLQAGALLLRRDGPQA